MVYCGRPSKACEPCRLRRLKCDHRRPGCTQCRNAGRVCSGYRADIDVNFRDHTDAVVQRYSSSSSSSSSQKSTRAAPAPAPVPIPAPESHLVVDTALHIAVTRFLSQTTHSVLSEYVLPLFSQSQCAPLLTASMQAISLACLANEQNRPDLLTPAREKYGLALQRLGRGLHTSLRMPGCNELPFIFCSVMLLAQFAGIASRSGEGRAEWSRHVNGAFSLLVTRALQHACPLTIPGQSLYLHVVSCLLLDCIQRRTTFSPQMRAILYARRADVSEFQLRFWGLMDRMCVLRAMEGRPGGPEGHLTPQRLNTAWEDLDREVRLLMQNMPLSYAYRSTSTAEIPVDNGKGLDTPYDVYATYRIAQNWNTLRMVRLFVQERLLEQQSTSSEDDSGNAKVKDCRAVIATLIQDICASVPRELRQSAGNQVQQLPSASGWAYSLVWPLSRAGASVHCPPESKTFIDRQMKILQERIGLDITGAQAPEEW
ncbi:Zn(II)2Cys6 transcription factor domain-containing protein [Aspergillus ibericus CBS 121593]|uniref:Zn(2)-C6 fungal-type domain-containing protein n=1 Tax=Aspergillus ibericus CBS 121593 TaxID=1448316 RepID=A0A395GR73_9EURO|nr:hypothetical protein BO80DRAFT_467208 [Aspergillus ibericus CBS 121593]RAK98060.1 hypothetical protein BO80DRAFT_467208 [Aspergillus ibericus CBS 121593]